MPSENEDLFSEFGKLYWGLSREMSYMWKDIFEKHFPGSQSHILFLLERHGQKKMSEVAESLYLTPGAVTTASDKLLKNGYIERVRDEQDRRSVYIAITDLGRETITKLQREGLAVMKVVFGHSSDKELGFLIETFKQANTTVSRIRKDKEV
ncbi:MarR family transcriptional regulator [Sporosarcina oncorhynchi]|uniref:MarR family transcriptional regulator n=1 Tax=Sporosarcina oncorhynchi TaxID=3056444 RepID=A0ABZ0L370_9BACL|nr:MarR family transcriptional regulator [Sporosarcina sp. T2O-4]WOV87055.1 MarR family transcriptional regulator [Sporosarcina sp. T2O-4]